VVECAAGAVFAEYIIESVLGRGGIGAFGAAGLLDFGAMVMRKFSEGVHGRPVQFRCEDADSSQYKHLTVRCTTKSPRSR